MEQLHIAVKTRGYCQHQSRITLSWDATGMKNDIDKQYMHEHLRMTYNHLHRVMRHFWVTKELT